MKQHRLHGKCANNHPLITATLHIYNDCISYKHICASNPLPPYTVMCKKDGTQHCGLWWTVVDCGGLWWTVVVCGGLWSVMVCGSLWSVVVCGLWWSVVVGTAKDAFDVNITEQILRSASASLRTSC